MLLKALKHELHQKFLENLKIKNFTKKFDQTAIYTSHPPKIFLLTDLRVPSHLF